MGFFDPAWASNKDIETALKAVKKETDQSTLAVIAKRACFNKVRVAAVNKLTDQLILVDIATNDSYRKSSDKASFDRLLNGITNSGDSNYESVVEAAINKLTDQSLIAYIAKGSCDPTVRIVALDKLTDQTIFADIAKNDKDNTVRIVVLNKLTDQTILADIAKNDREKVVWKAALNNLTDQSILANFAKAGTEEKREIAIENLSDKSTLMELAKKDDSNLNIRSCAIKRLYTKGYLQNDEIEELVQSVLKRIRETTEKSINSRKCYYKLPDIEVNVVIRDYGGPSHYEVFYKGKQIDQLSFK